MINVTKGEPATGNVNSTYYTLNLWRKTSVHRKLTNKIHIQNMLYPLCNIAVTCQVRLKCPTYIQSVSIHQSVQYLAKLYLIYTFII